MNDLAERIHQAREHIARAGKFRGETTRDALLSTLTPASREARRLHLLANGVIVKDGGKGRSTRYRLVKPE